jgi:O-methyltransferase
MRIAHKRLHRNNLFYTLTPELTIAILQAFQENKIIKGAYYEFGVFKGYNLWFTNRIQPRMEIYGFDSFAGMPASKGAHPHHARGGYSEDIMEVRKNLIRFGADSHRITLTKGWFSKENFASLPFHFPPAAVAVIDCDLYQSCVPVLDFLYPLLRSGSILLFDDWYMTEPSEKTAMEEFLKEHQEIATSTLFRFGTYGLAMKVFEIG